MQTLRYSALGGSEQLRPEGRLFRILTAVKNGPRPIYAIFDAARNPTAEKPHREAGKTKGGLHALQARRWIVWAGNVVSITDAGREALAEVGVFRSLPPPRGAVGATDWRAV